MWVALWAFISLVKDIGILNMLSETTVNSARFIMNLIVHIWVLHNIGYTWWHA